MRQTPEQKDMAMATLVKVALKYLGEADWIEITEQEKHSLWGLLEDLEK